MRDYGDCLPTGRQPDAEHIVMYFGRLKLKAIRSAYDGEIRSSKSEILNKSELPKSKTQNAFAIWICFVWQYDKLPAKII